MATVGPLCVCVVDDRSVSVTSRPQSQSISTALRSRRKPCEVDFEMMKLISNGAYG